MIQEDTTQNEDHKTEQKKTHKSPNLGWRKSSKVRIIVIVVLMAIVAALFFFWGKFRIVLVGIFILLLATLGLEVSGSDWDLNKLLETGSFSQSKIEQTTDGQWLFDNCNENNLNCANFEYQEDAQDVYEECLSGGEDVHRLVGDNDGIVCEALPSRPE